MKPPAAPGRDIIDNLRRAVLAPMHYRGAVMSRLLDEAADEFERLRWLSGDAEPEARA